VHASWLREWLGRNCGWTLHVETELARLRKTPGNVRDATRGAGDSSSDLPFSRRRYSLFCLALTSLERADRQTTLGNVARDILAAFASEPAFAAAGMQFELENRDARRDLVHVVRLLLHLRVLTRIHGLEESFVERQGDVLYNVNRPALAATLAVRRGPSTVTAVDFESRLRSIVEEPQPDGEEARNRGSDSVVISSSSPRPGRRSRRTGWKKRSAVTVRSSRTRATTGKRSTTPCSS
jgi:uncharacterized protein (TIGR02678 family)